ncbi:MAG: hypothetical protein A3K19_19590 [Lentisphaerae bacterium RIFOXYB12_FULL_65_16]|nr:MAG: hypothetical protein A3K18_31225 [Lentisphaerae bacterium RIFOXYA12_64_32]OGV92066.1 MAG: hypothetical protein A3K19_19590 [Lentisphaerae bacterium RIFOXYB12_FULL_65_16]
MITERRVGCERIAGWRLTEVPALYGLVIRERGELIEYVSFAEARRRLDTAAKSNKAHSSVSR